MNTIRTFAAAAVLLSASLCAHAAPAIEENGSANESSKGRPEFARTMTAAAKAKTQSTAKPQQVAYYWVYQWYCNGWGQCEYRTICF